MLEKSGRSLSPCVEVNGRMLADVHGDEVTKIPGIKETNHRNPAMASFDCLERDCHLGDPKLKVSPEGLFG
jgi:hypothetical protein